MVNMDDFIKRLETILEFYGLSASLFADKMGIQRSGLSHLMSGRNKPSLDFVMKIVENFPDVDFYWLLNGNGVFPKLEETNRKILDERKAAPPLFSTDATSMDLFSSEVNEIVKEDKTVTDLFSQPEIMSNKSLDNAEITKSKGIERIVIFYTNGTFKEYTAEN